MVKKLLLLLAILCECRGQIFYDTGDTIRSDGSILLSVSSNSRKICYDGTDIYYTQGTQIFRLQSPPTLMLTAPSDIDSLSCAQDAIAYTYVTPAVGTTPAMSNVLFCNINDVDICFTKSYANVGRMAVAIATEKRKLLLITVTSGIFYFNIDDFGGGGRELHLPDLGIDLGCCKVYCFGDVLVIFCSHLASSRISRIWYNTMTDLADVVNFNMQNINGEDTIVSCIDITDDMIYFLNDGVGAGSSQIDQYPVAGWISGPPFPASSSATTVVGPVPGNIPDNVNGLIVCTAALCPAAPATSCTATQCPLRGGTRCGFCTALAPTECVCSNSNNACCQYLDSTLESICNVPIVPADACCVINNPLAQRRRPGDVNIFAAAGESASFDFPRRTSPIGRFGINELPTGTMSAGNDGTNVWWRRFQVPTPGSLRGQRFGVFLAEVDPTGASETQYIHCLVTENSGFYNRLYTYTRVAGTGASNSVQLVASTNTRVSMFVSTMRWQFRQIDQSTNMPVGGVTQLGSCTSSLMCTIGPPLMKSHEGIYEIYRPGRQLRLWHPIFFLYVRECSRIQYMSGGSCVNCAIACVHGDCVENQCICYPGFMGAACNSVTTLGMVGQNGDIPCSTFNFDTTAPLECRDLLFCYANKIGCRCSTGLRPPKCWFDCESGTWGSNCAETCSPPCNRRDGIF